MHNVWLIARREYLERIRTRGFVVTTILIPLIMGGFIYGSIFLGNRPTSNLHIAVVSSDTQLALDLQDQLQNEIQRPRALPSPSSSTPTPAKAATPARPPRIAVDTLAPSPDTRTLLNREIASGDLDGYLWIVPAARPAGRPTFTFTPRSSAESSALRAGLASALHTVLMRESLAHRGVVADDVDTMLSPVQIASAPAPMQRDPASAIASVTVLFFLMYMVIMLYGMNVARSIIEEKTSRIFEVLLATIRPEEMMAGKIIGVGSVGLTQVGIWLMAFLAGAPPLAARLGMVNLQIGLTPAQIVWFFVYFLLGYLFYSSIAAALGAMTNSEQELQQLNMFLVLPLAVCFLTLRSILTSPDGRLATVLALIPPFTPLLMYLRVSLGHPSPSEIAASILLTSASIYAIIWITSRIYRVGVLMYGKRPNIPELLRWLKYS